MAISTIERARVTITIPADCIDDFRVGVLADLKSDAEGFGVRNAEMLEAKDEYRGHRREDRDGHMEGIRDTCALLEQLPDEDIEATVSGTTTAFGFALAAAGRLLVERLRDQFQYGPLPVGEVLRLVERLRWTVGQLATIEAEA